jgi:hypothetical protein
MGVQYHLQKESDVVGWLPQTVCTEDVANISLKATRVQQWLGGNCPFVSLGALLIHSALSKIRLSMTRSELW